MAAAKKAATKKAVPKKAEEKAPVDPEVIEVQTVAEAAGPEMEGEAYHVGYHGVSVDDEDYSVAAQVAKLAEQ